MAPIISYSAVPFENQSHLLGELGILVLVNKVVIYAVAIQIILLTYTFILLTRTRSKP